LGGVEDCGDIRYRIVHLSRPRHGKLGEPRPLSTRRSKSDSISANSN